jgi:hypothetical protein
MRCGWRAGCGLGLVVRAIFRFALHAQRSQHRGRKQQAGQQHSPAQCQA